MTKLFRFSVGRYDVETDLERRDAMFLSCFADRRMTQTNREILFRHIIYHFTGDAPARAEQITLPALDEKHRGGPKPGLLYREDVLIERTNQLMIYR